MAPSRCAVQDCSNRASKAKGISIHRSPVIRKQRNIWVRFMQTHRADFKRLPDSRFAVCSEHFTQSSFERIFKNTGRCRRLKEDAIPTIWKKKNINSPISKRRRRKVRNLPTCTWRSYSVDGCVYLTPQKL